MKNLKRGLIGVTWLFVLTFLSCAKPYLPKVGQDNFSEALEFTKGAIPCTKEFQKALNFSEFDAFARQAQVSYASDTSEAIKACRAGKIGEKDSCAVFDGHFTGARAVVFRNDSIRTQWVAFRGTQTPFEVMLDMDYSLVPDPELGIYLHRGFSKGANELLPLIIPRLTKDYPVFITGHSLGGAMAAIMALRLHAQGFNVKVRTFGQPKVTNMKGAIKIDSILNSSVTLNVLRFVNGRDMVARLPPVDWKPEKPIRPFAHFGREIDLTDVGYECLEEHKYKLDGNSLQAEAADKAVDDHSLDLYLEKIGNLAEMQKAIFKR